MSEQNPHIRTNTSAAREGHLRYLAGTDDAMRDAVAMLDESRREEERLRAVLTSIAQQALRAVGTWRGSVSVSDELVEARNQVTDLRLLLDEAVDILSAPVDLTDADVIARIEAFVTKARR
jgi:hypothetical protein